MIAVLQCYVNLILWIEFTWDFEILDTQLLFDENWF